MDPITEAEILQIAIPLAAGILAGSGVPHHDIKGVSALAVKHARALIAEIARFAVEEKNRVEAARRSTEIDKQAAARAAAAEKERAEEEREAQKRLSKSK